MIIRISNEKSSVEYGVDVDKETMVIRNRDMDDFLELIVGGIETYDDLNRFVAKRCNNNQELKTNLKLNKNYSHKN